MKTKRTNKLYNYLVNTYGLSKEMVMEYVKERLDELISKHIAEVLNSEKFNRDFNYSMAKFLETEKTSNHYWDRKNSFKKVIEDTTRKIIIEEITKNYNLSIDIKEKQKKEE
jgi:hypothetical protein